MRELSEMEEAAFAGELQELHNKWRGEESHFILISTMVDVPNNKVNFPLLSSLDPVGVEFVLNLLVKGDTQKTNDRVITKEEMPNV